MAIPARSELADRTTGLVGWTIAWRAASAVTTLALEVVIARQLGRVQYGIYASVLSGLIYLAVLATFGQDQSLLRYVPEVLARRDRLAALDLLRKSFLAMLALWLATSLAVLAARPLIDSLLNAHVGGLLALGSFLLLGTIAAGMMSFALVGIYDMRSQALATPVAGGLTLVLAVVLLRLGAGVPGVLIAGACGQSALALFYLRVLIRRIRLEAPIPSDRIGWRRLLMYASGWLPSLLIASAVGLEFETFFLLRFAGPVAAGYYRIGYAIPQRLVALIPSILTGAWVVGTLEGGRAREVLRSAVAAFYKGIFLVAFPLALGAGALLGPLILAFFKSAYAPSASIAPVMLGCFIAALLAAPWGLVVRVRELAWLNALVNITQVGVAAVADLWLISHYGLWGAVAAVALTTGLTLALSFGVWRLADPASLTIPWAYAGRCLLAALPYALLFPLAAASGRFSATIRLAFLLLASALLTAGWLWLVRRLALLDVAEVPLLHDSRHRAVRAALGWLAPTEG
jgi:O-antigen/teichoic acid export membrane protein